MTAAEAQSWVLFYKIYGPFGTDRDDWRNAALIHAILSPHLSQEDRKGIEHYLLKFAPPTAEGDADNLALNLYQLLRH